MSSKTLKQIAGLHRLTGPQLKERWRALYGTEPPGYSRTFLVSRLAYRLQELAYGGLSQAVRAKMEHLLAEAAPVNHP